jgi:hypothetical protein
MSKTLLIIEGAPRRFTVVKALFLVFAVVLCPVAALAEDWTTTDGTKYQNVRVVRIEDDAVTILYKDGGAMVFLNKLSPALQARFGYDPVKAKAAAEARTKADLQNAKELQAEIDLAEQLKRKQQIADANAKNGTNTPPKY